MTAPVSHRGGAAVSRPERAGPGRTRQHARRTQTRRSGHGPSAHLARWTQSVGRLPAGATACLGRRDGRRWADGQLGPSDTPRRPVLGPRRLQSTNKLSTSDRWTADIRWRAYGRDWRLHMPTVRAGRSGPLVTEFLQPEIAPASVTPADNVSTRLSAAIACHR